MASDNKTTTALYGGASAVAFHHASHLIEFNRQQLVSYNDQSRHRSQVTFLLPAGQSFNRGRTMLEGIQGRLTDKKTRLVLASYAKNQPPSVLLTEVVCYTCLSFLLLKSPQAA